MSRNTDLSTVMFPVEVRPIGLQAESAADNRQDLESSPAFETIEKYQAIVRLDTGIVFSVVSSRYELLHNSLALELGKKAFQLLFPKTSEDDFIPYDIRATKTGSACHIDLIHKDYNTNVWEQETWLPFLRVSNSYNRSRALTFDFGFVRELCSNGLIFRKESIQAKFYHTKGELNIDLDQDDAFQKLKDLEAEFSNYMIKLRKIEITRELIKALSLHLLGLSFDLNGEDGRKREKEHERLNDVSDALESMISGYIEEHGTNAYTALNVSTDFATHTPTTAGNFVNSASLQQEIGQRVKMLSELPEKGKGVADLIQPELKWLDAIRPNFQ